MPCAEDGFYTRGDPAAEDDLHPAYPDTARWDGTDDRTSKVHRDPDSLLKNAGETGWLESSPGADSSLNRSLVNCEPVRLSLSAARPRFASQKAGPQLRRHEISSTPLPRLSRLVFNDTGHRPTVGPKLTPTRISPMHGNPGTTHRTNASNNLHWG